MIESTVIPVRKILTNACNFGEMFTTLCNLIILVGAGPPFGSFLAVGIQQIVEICGIHGEI